MSIPIVCGTYPSLDILAEGAQCPVCRAPALQLVEETVTPCFCFLPLCCVGASRTYAACARCQATMSSVFFASTPSSGAPQPSQQATRAGVKGGGGRREPLLPQGGQ